MNVNNEGTFDFEPSNVIIRLMLSLTATTNVARQNHTIMNYSLGCTCLL